jgi:hypothetical protein
MHDNVDTDPCERTMHENVHTDPSLFAVVEASRSVLAQWDKRPER